MKKPFSGRQTELLLCQLAATTRDIAVVGRPAHDGVKLPSGLKVSSFDPMGQQHGRLGLMEAQQLLLSLFKYLRSKEHIRQTGSS